VSRLGLVCRGTVYLLVGYLALRLALAIHGRSAAPASSTGALQAVTEPAWGRVLLVLLVAGLAAYALTQLIEAVFRPSHAGTTIGRWRQRAVSSSGCLLYLAFCLSTARLLAAAAEGNGGVGTSARDRHDLQAADPPSAVGGGAPASASLARKRRPLTGSFPGKNRHLSGGRGGVGTP
jgi:hypothetical protein